MTRNSREALTSLLRVTLVLLTSQYVGGTVLLRGAGASFPSAVYREWLSTFEAQRRIFVDLLTSYDIVGSGRGKEMMMGEGSRDVEYGASDSMLTEEEYRKYPDLQMIPTMAGAVVLGYNLPGVSSLRLSRESIVGLYNGTITMWDDPALQKVNPNVTLPSERVRVVARQDTSGTTELFTRALTSFSQEWAAEYGIFDSGLDSNFTPIHWNPDAITYYGLTNRGVSGLVMSIQYTLAYLSAADAMEYNTTSAWVLNKVGHPVLATPEAVQEAMVNASLNMSDRLTADITDSDAHNSYPIAGFTYLIVRMSTMEDCNSAIELYRYILWFLQSKTADDKCVSLNMVPLSDNVAKRVEEVLKKKTCRGQSLWVLVDKQMNREKRQLQTWRLPLFISLPFIILAVIGVLAYSIYRYIKLNMAIIKEAYKIQANRLRVMDKTGMENNGVSFASMKSQLTTMSDQTADAKSFVVGKLDGEHLVIMNEIKFLQINSLKKKTKNALLWMQNHVSHPNVQSLLGVYDQSGVLFTLSPYCSKGTLEDVLFEDKYKLDENFRFSMSVDIATGMEYLHSKDIIHGLLSCASCYIDHKWTVRIAQWERNQLARSQFGKSINNVVCPGDAEAGEGNESVGANELIRKPPEVLIGTNVKPSKAGDVFSFGLLVHEVFSLRLPYPELEDAEPANMVALMRQHPLKPKVHRLVPTHLASLLYEMWTPDPRHRPLFGQVIKVMKRANPSKMSVLDCMMQAVDEYVNRLEEKIHERTAELRMAMNKVQNLLNQMLPPSVAERLAQGGQVEPEAFDSVTVYFSDIKGFTSMSAESTPMQIVALLNALYTLFDDICDRHDVYKVETIGDAYMVISGLPTPNGIQHAGHVSNMALDLACALESFRIPHRPRDKLQLRIGIHSGAVVAGVVGVKMPRYCLFGDTVNTASRMESTSLAMKIQISEDTERLLRKIGSYDIVPRGKVEVKGKGQMKTFWLHGREGHTPPPAEFLRDVATEE